MHFLRGCCVASPRLPPSTYPSHRGSHPCLGDAVPLGLVGFCDALCVIKLPTCKYEQYLFNRLRMESLFATFTAFAYVLEIKWSKVAYVLEEKWLKVAYVLERILYICIGVSID